MIRKSRHVRILRNKIDHFLYLLVLGSYDLEVLLKLMSPEAKMLVGVILGCIVLVSFIAGAILC